MAQLRAIAQLVPVPRFSPSNITPAPDTAWTQIGKGSDTLRGELEKLYWAGIKSELENIIRNVKLWQDPEFAGVVLAKENPEEEWVHGYTTFLEQVSHEARAFAFRQGMYLLTYLPTLLTFVMVMVHRRKWN